MSVYDSTALERAVTDGSTECDDPETAKVYPKPPRRDHRLLYIVCKNCGDSVRDERNGTKV